MSKKGSKKRKEPQSDDDGSPEAVSFSAGKSAALDEKHKQRLNKLQIEEEKKEKRIAKAAEEAVKAKENAKSSKSKKTKRFESDEPIEDSRNKKKQKKNESNREIADDLKDFEKKSKRDSGKSVNESEEDNENEKKSKKSHQSSTKLKETTPEDPPRDNSEKRKHKRSDSKNADMRDAEVETPKNASEPKRKEIKLPEPLPVEVLQKAAEDLRLKQALEERKSLKRSREEVLSNDSDNVDFDNLDNIRIPSDEMSGSGEEDGEPLAKKPKTYGDGTEIDAKVKQFLRGHFWADRIPRSDPNQYFSERIQYGPALNFADDEDVDSIEELLGEDDL